MLTFAPDAVETSPEILTAVSGIPTMRGYGPPPTATSFSTAALASVSAGGNWVLTANGVGRLLAATGTTIFEFGSAAWTSRGTWIANNAFFLVFGSDVFAIGSATKPQIVTSTLTAVTAPRASAGDTAGYFMMLGATDDSSTGLSTTFGSQSNRWWCSAYADATSTWTPNVTTQCATALLSDSSGGITGIRALGDRFIVYKSGSMYVGSYIGPPEVFGFQRISDRIGAFAQAAVVKVDGAHFFLGAEDVWRYDGTGYPASIGSGVREWLYASMDRAQTSLIRGRHDPYNQLVYWHYSPNGASGALTKVLVYHYPSNRFGAFDFTVTQAFQTEGGFLYNTTSDGAAKVLTMAYLDAAFVIKSLSAAGTALSLTTAWSGDEERVSLCDRVKPKFGATAPSAGTLDADTCMSIGGSITDIAQASLSSARFDILASARYHRQIMALTGSAFELQAVGARLIPEGQE